MTTTPRRIYEVLAVASVLGAAWPLELPGPPPAPSAPSPSDVARQAAAAAKRRRRAARLETLVATRGLRRY